MRPMCWIGVFWMVELMDRNTLHGAMGGLMHHGWMGGRTCMPADALDALDHAANDVLSAARARSGS